MASKIAFPFVLDLLLPLEMRVKPMFGCHALYHGEKIMLIVRDREDHENANGVWFATDYEHHESLRKELPSMCSVDVLSDGKSETRWQMIRREADSFEEEVNHLCDLIRKADPRIGKIPKGKKKKKA